MKTVDFWLVLVGFNEHQPATHGGNQLCNFYPERHHVEESNERTVLLLVFAELAANSIYKTIQSVVASYLVKERVWPRSSIMFRSNIPFVWWLPLGFLCTCSHSKNKTLLMEWPGPVSEGRGARHWNILESLNIILYLNLETTKKNSPCLPKCHKCAKLNFMTKTQQ